MKNLIASLIVLFAVGASVAIADGPTVNMPLAGPTTQSKKASGENGNVSWTIKRVDLSGVDASVRAKIKATLEAEIKSALAEAEEIGDDIPEQISISIEQRVTLVNENLLSVQTNIHSDGVAAYPVTSLNGQTFDLKTGQSIAPSSVFAGGSPSAALVSRLATQIAQEHLEAGDMIPALTATHAKRYVITPEGMTFLLDGLAARVVGLHTADLTWRELGSDIARPGPLAEFFPGGEENYLSHLASRVHEELAILGVDERRALLEGGPWQSATNLDGFLKAIGKHPSLETVYDNIVEARDAARARYPEVDFASIADREREEVQASVYWAAHELETARVMGSKPQPLLPFGNPDAAPLAHVDPQTAVNVNFIEEDGSPYLRVQLDNGVSGLMLSNALLIEYPVVLSGVATVNGDGMVQLKVEHGTHSILPMDGPGAPDATLDALIRSLGTSSKASVQVTGIMRDIGERSWIAVESFKLQSAAGNGSGSTGMTDELEK